MRADMPLLVSVPLQFVIIFLSHIPAAKLKEQKAKILKHYESFAVVSTSGTDLKRKQQRKKQVWKVKAHYVSFAVMRQFPPNTKFVLCSLGTGQTPFSVDKRKEQQ